MTISTHAAAAKAIRAELKKMGIKASVRSECFAGGNSVTVKVNNLSPTEYEKVAAMANSYQYGHFDGMTDMYEYSNRNPDLPQVKYVSVNNEMDEETTQAAWDYIRKHFAGADELPANYADVDNNAMLHGQYVSSFVYRFMCDSFEDSTANFWKEYKASKAPVIAPKRAVESHIVNGVTVRPGTRDGFTELVFDEKPDADVRAELKAARFRWSPRNGVWFGRTDNLPETYR